MIVCFSLPVKWIGLASGATAAWYCFMAMVLTDLTHAVFSRVLLMFAAMHCTMAMVLTNLTLAVYCRRALPISVDMPSRRAGS